MTLTLKGASIANNSYVDADDIGENVNALLCNTDNDDCCDKHPRKGEWYFSGNKVGVLGMPPGNNLFYRNRGSSVVRLNRRGTPSQRGHFWCEVPGSDNINHTVFVNIGMFFSTFSINQFCQSYHLQWTLVQ